MTVSIDATNLVLIDAADATTGWTSSMGGLNTVTAAAREGGTALQDQASEESYEVFHTITSEDYLARTIFGWQKSGGPSVETDPAGFAMVLGDALRDVATAVVAAGGASYTALDVLTVAGGTLVAGGVAATIRVDTVDGGGAILTSTLLDGGDYAADAPTPNSVTGGTGSGATFTLTFAAIPNRIAYAVGGQDNFGFFFQGWSMFRLNTADLPTNARVVTGAVADIAPDVTVDVGYGGNFPGKAAGNSDNVGFDVLRYCANANPALLIEGGTTGARGTWQQVTSEDENTNNAWGIVRQLVPGSKAFEVNFGLQLGSLDSTAFFEDADFQLFLNGDIPDAGAGISAGSMDVDVVGGGAFTNVVNLADFLIQGLGAVSNWDMSDADLDELKIERGTFTDLGTIFLPVQDVGNRFLADIVFNNCGQITPDTLDLDRITINGTTDANGALFLDEATHSNMSVLSFVSDGSGHAIQLIPVGAGPFTFTWDNWVFSGYGADDTTDAVLFVDNALDADITINIINGGDTPTVRKAAGYTGTVTINNTVTLTVQCNDADGNGILSVSVRIENASTGALIAQGTTNASGTFTDSTFNFTGDLAVTVKARLKGFFFDRQGGTITSSGLAASFTLRTNPIVDLP